MPACGRRAAAGRRHQRMCALLRPGRPAAPPGDGVAARRQQLAAPAPSVVPRRRRWHRHDLRLRLSGQSARTAETAGPAASAGPADHVRAFVGRRPAAAGERVFPGPRPALRSALRSALRRRQNGPGRQGAQAAEAADRMAGPWSARHAAETPTGRRRRSVARASSPAGGGVSGP